MNIKTVILFLLAFLLGISAFLLFDIPHTPIQKTKKPISISHFSLEKAPPQSLLGKILTFSGTINWQSRVATQSSPLNIPRLIQQGEELETKKNSQLLLEFASAATISFSPNTILDFSQTLPVNVVIHQIQGTALYTKIGDKTPLSIRGFSLLANIDKGISKISVDESKQKIIINVLSGQTTVGFNDSNNISNVIAINPGQQFTFDDNTKTYLVK